MAALCRESPVDATARRDLSLGHTTTERSCMSSAARLFAALLCTLFIAGCASTGNPNAAVSGTGVVTSIQETQKASTGANVVGAVGGAVLGAWAGSAIGGGTGQTIASVAGGVGGSMAGSAVANNVAQQTVYDVSIQFDDGITRTLRVDQRPNVRPGSKVRVTNGVITPL
jgi:outer membrane lipoprotein SlyB